MVTIEIRSYKNTATVTTAWGNYQRHYKQSNHSLAMKILPINQDIKSLDEIWGERVSYKRTSIEM